MRCEEFEERLNELLDRRLSPAADPFVQSHLTDCADCQALYDSLEAALAVVKRRPAAAPSPSFTEAVLSKVQTERRRRRALLATCAAIAVLLAVAPALLAPRRPQAPAIVDQRETVETTNIEVAASESPPPVGVIARRSANAYWSLAKGTGDHFAGAIRIVPAAGRNSSESWTDATAEIESASIEQPAPTELATGSDSTPGWLTGVATGFRPLADSTGAALESLLDLLPAEQGDARS